MHSRRWIWAGLLTLLGPGAGHIYLKYKRRGWFLLGSTCTLLLFGMAHIFIRLAEYQKKMPIHKTADPMEALVRSTQFVSNFFNNSSSLITGYSTVIGLIFIASYVDLGWLWYSAWKQVKPH